MQTEKYLKEIVLTIVAYAWLLFVSTNVNIVLGQTYLHFTLGAIVLLTIGAVIFDRDVRITFQKQKGGTLKAIFMGFVGYLILLVASVFALRIFDPANATFGSIIQLMGATTPALAQSKIANFITFALAIPFVETQLWARGLEFICDLFRIPINKQNVTKVFTALMLVIVLLSFGFLIFHLTAKGVIAIGALVVVMIMMIISLCMVAIFQETRQAVWTHIIANSIASYIMLFAVSSV